MRAMMGMAFGAIAGLMAGIAAALVLAIAVGVFGAVEDGFETGLGLAFIYALFGSIVAAVIGSLVGAVAGLLIGALKVEAYTPAISAVVAAAPALVVCALIALDGEGQSLSPGVRAVMALVMVGAVLAYAAIGYGAGVFFVKAVTKSSAGREESYSPPPSYVG